jgi:peptide deformylase
MKILTHPNPILKQKSQAVTVFDDQLRMEVSEMIDTVNTVQGMALAAPQVGISKRLFVLADKPELKEFPQVVINPRIKKPKGTTDFEEGCLSIPGVYKMIERFESFILEYRDLDGIQKTVNATGMFAIVCQHEIDHLDGKLIIDDQ